MDDIDHIKAQIKTYALKHHVMIATAESCTAGMISAALTDLAGSSAYFDRGFITYSNEAKQEMLGVTRGSLNTHGAVSEAVAEEMARGALKSAKASLAISVTGLAGPGDSEFKPEGRVCFALSAKTKSDKPALIACETRDFGAIGRDAVRQSTTKHALTLIINYLVALDQSTGI